jgi:hypothetical protein
MPPEPVLVNTHKKQGGLPESQTLVKIPMSL